MRILNNTLIRISLKTVILIALGSIILIFTTNTRSAIAVTGTDFDAGNIISDSVFFDQNSMNANLIQQFLDSKVPVCDTNGAQPYGGTTRAAYSASRGYPAPYTCLKDYSQTVQAITNGGSDLCTGSITGGTKSAAQIIYDVSRACGINPQVLIVLLQKEQSLVTDDWPWSLQYRSATGYGCPDTAPCDAEYYGFFNQVYQAAKAFRRYEANPSSYNYRAGRNNNIYYHPSLGACGGSNVFIQNQATANLYIYTPYQPNQAALDNLYGTGDGCSAYGNRNFWRIFNDWFGGTNGAPFSASYRSQTPSFTLRNGESTTVQMSFTNTGTSFWKDDSTSFPGYNPVRLATAQPSDRRSAFRSDNWLTGNRPSNNFAKVYEADGTTLSSDQGTVFPGQIARFEFNITVPTDLPPGVYREYFHPILVGQGSLGPLTWLEITVPPTTFVASYVSQSAYPTLLVGNSTDAFFKFKNSGNGNWYSAGTRPDSRIPSVGLSTNWPIGRQSNFSDSSWENSSLPLDSFTKVYESDGSTLATNQSRVQPGQIAEFSFKLNAATSSAAYTEYFSPSLIGSSYKDLKSVAFLRVDVEAREFKASYRTQSSYPTIQRGDTEVVEFRFQNTGTMFWKDSSSTFPGYWPVHLATSWPINRSSSFRSSDWTLGNRPVTEFTTVYESDGVTLSNDQNTVLPGQIGVFEFSLTIPNDHPLGTFREHFQPILEGSGNWNLGISTHLDVTVID